MVECLSDRIVHIGPLLCMCMYMNWQYLRSDARIRCCAHAYGNENEHHGKGLTEKWHVNAVRLVPSIITSSVLKRI